MVKLSHDVLSRDRDGALQRQGMGKPTLAEELGDLTEQELAEVLSARGGRICDCFSVTAGRTCDVHPELVLRFTEAVQVLEAREAACNHLFGVKRPDGWGDW